MKIVVFNLKGGQGKTAIALNLALSLDANIITNDKYTYIDLVLPKDYYITVETHDDFPVIEEDLNLIYDLGSWLDSRALEVLEKSDLIIIPIINRNTNNLASLNSIKEVLNINKNILIVANATEKNDFQEITNLVSECFSKYNLPILEIKKTTAFERIVDYKKPIKDITKENSLFAFSFREVSKQFDDIIEFIKNKITGDFFKKDFEKKRQEALNKKNKRNNRVMLALNDEEYNKLLDLAGRQRLAVFIRNKIIDLES